jgi:RNA polymerase sigma-70 factor (ECF subfamily)
MLASPPAQGGSGDQDLLLVRRALAGETEAVERVLARLSCTVRFVFRLNRSLGYDLRPDSLDEVVQQVYAAIWPRLPDYAGAAALESWVYGFCRNCLRAEVRRIGADRRGSAGIDPDHVGDAESRPETAAHRREALDALRDELDALPTAEREVVELRHLEGWTYERIAGHLRQPPSTVKDRCYKALAKMRGRLTRRDVSA